MGARIARSDPPGAQRRAHLCKLRLRAPCGAKTNSRTTAVAIFHLSVKTISRSAGRSATAAAAYRAGVEITDERTGEIHDYTRKGGVESAAVILPDGAPDWARDRAQLWNAAEQAEKRKNSTVAREFEVALPAELPADERQALAHEFARALVKRHGCAADVAIHAPGKEGDHRNHHAHILLTTRRLGPDGFGEKTRELDDQKTGKVLVTEWRERWAGMANARLERHGHTERIDHRSHAARGIEATPSQHLGPTATAIERRTREPSSLRLQHAQEAAERLANARELGELERRGKAVGVALIDLSCDLNAAKAERYRQEQQAQQASQKPAGIDPRSRYHPDNIAKHAAQEAAAPAKPAPLTVAERYDLARAEKKRAIAARQAVEIEARRVAPPPQPASTPAPFDAAAKKAQWDAAIKAERALYLKELTAQAHAKAVAGVAEHQAHVDAKPLLLGRQKWEAERQGFEHRDAANRLEWQNLKDGRYPFTAKEQEAVQRAVERRVGDKNPALARDMPKVEAALLEARRQALALDREQQAKRQAERAAQQPDRAPKRGPSMGR